MCILYFCYSLSSIRERDVVFTVVTQHLGQSLAFRCCINICRINKHCDTGVLCFCGGIGTDLCGDRACLEKAFILTSKGKDKKTGKKFHVGRRFG